MKTISFAGQQNFSARQRPVTPARVNSAPAQFGCNATQQPQFGCSKTDNINFAQATGKGNKVNYLA